MCMMTKSVTIELLNHASLRIDSGAVSLLTDPWYSGLCFRGGWGLRQHNPDAMARATAATHLWISHLHGDHLHFPTLKELAKQAPDIRVLSNQCANFEVEKILQPLGFRSFIPLPERDQVSLAEDFRLTRYPTSGMDNMLVMHVGGKTILNFNDCNLPSAAIRSLRKRIGHVDVLMMSFNHAGKCFLRDSPAAIKAYWKERFHRTVDAIAPRYAIPFASGHYYRAKDSAWQNASLMMPEELGDLSPAVLPMKLGTRLVLGPAQAMAVEVQTAAIEDVAFETKKPAGKADWAAVVAAANAHRELLKRVFLGLTFWMPPLRILVEDQKRVLVFDMARGISAEEPRGQEQIAAGADSLVEWFKGPFGTDTFSVGADFALKADDTRPLDRLFLAGLLMDNRLSARDLFRLALSPAGWKFLGSRREELWALVRTGALRSARPRD
jgi:L-ascorbate metabolism protein UlaG (beta-lactamase superfamily)